MFQVKNKNDIITHYQSGKRKFPQIILTGVNLSGTSLTEINLDESNLIEINWSNCNLDRASFIRACLCLGNFN